MSMIKNYLLVILFVCIQYSLCAQDYSQYKISTSAQTFTLSNIYITNKCTKVDLLLTITSNDAGYFFFQHDIFIEANGVKYYIKDVIFENDSYWEYDKFTYSQGYINKKRLWTLVFERIPDSATKINYGNSGRITWYNIPIKSSCTTPHTEWTEQKLKEHWKSGANPIEGIYKFLSTDNSSWWGDSRQTLAVVRQQNKYRIIYLKGSNPSVWKEGDLKAECEPTATPGLYKADRWYMENKMPNTEFYIFFDGMYLKIYEGNSSTTADFIKLYPGREFFDESDTSKPDTSSTNADQIKSTGSGVVISSNGIIATNYHVIEDAKEINVSIKENNNIITYSAKVLCSDQTNDLALLSIKDPKFNGFEAIPYELALNTNDVGTPIYSMSYPMTNYMGEEIKVTDGIISSKSGYKGDVATYQISAPIQPGSSGGPLFNKQGQLVGITSSGLLEANSVGYAIKSMFLYNLIESAPITISTPTDNKISHLSFTEQIKALSGVVAYITIK